MTTRPLVRGAKLKYWLENLSIFEPLQNRQHAIITPHSFEEKKWGKRLKRKRESPISMEREEERREE